MGHVEVKVGHDGPNLRRPGVVGGRIEVKVRRDEPDLPFKQTA